MDSFLKLPADERKLVFKETAKRYDVPNAIVIEKDFWVCWTLKQIFGLRELGQYLTFKGGTSLSKAYQIIDRFSEDIDLTIGRTAPYLWILARKPVLSDKQLNMLTAKVKAMGYDTSLIYYPKQPPAKH